jgi:predicted nucleic acid-binding Zn ribbon protein
MSNKPYQSLGDAIEAFLEKNQLKDQAAIQQIISDWEKLMGRPIASHTEKIWFQRGTLFIRLNSPPWRNELSMARIKIRDLVNKQVGRELVTEVKIL